MKVHFSLEAFDFHILLKKITCAVGLLVKISRVNKRACDSICKIRIRRFGTKVFFELVCQSVSATVRNVIRVRRFLL